MDLRDADGALYRIPARRLREYRVPDEAVARLRGLPSVGPGDLAAALPPGVEAATVRFLHGGGRMYAVPRDRLAGWQAPDPTAELLESGRRLVEDGQRLLAGEGRLEPTDLEALYPAEMAVPEVRRVHEWFASRDPFTAFFEGEGVPADPVFTYGQTAVPAVFRALRRVGLGPQDRFLDLGCGCGAAALLAAHFCSAAVGVDLVPAAIRFCRRAAAELGVENTEFRVEDGRLADLSRATVIYVAATAFSEELCQELEDHLRSASPGTRVISISRPFRSLESLGEASWSFSWTGYGQACPVQFYFGRVASTTR